MATPKIKTYISLPIDTEGYDINLQRRKARMWQRYFEAEGHVVSNPFDIYDRLVQFHKDNHKQPPTRREIMTEDLTELMTNDHIFICDGWENSSGCIEEAELAISQNIKIQFEKYMNV